MRKPSLFLPSLFVASVITLVVVIKIGSSDIDFDTRVLQVAASEEEVLSGVELVSATPTELAMTVALGRQGYEAARLYPIQSEYLFELLGNAEAFKSALDWYGPRYVIPVTYFFGAAESPSMTAEATIGDALAELWHSAKELRLPNGSMFKLSDMTPTRRAFMALVNIRDGGNAFIGRFDLVFDAEFGESIAVRQVGRTTLDAITGALIGNMLALEKKYHERDVTMKDVGWAVFDVVTLVGVVKAIKLAKGTKAATLTAKEGVKRTTKGNWALTKRVATNRVVIWSAKQSAKLGAVVGGLYLVFTHPMLVLSGITQIASAGGTLGLILATTLGLMLLTVVVWCALVVLRVFARTRRLSDWIVRQVRV